MTDKELFDYHMRELKKTFERMHSQYREQKKKTDDKWISSKSDAAKYLDISRATFYKHYIHKGLRWIDGKGCKKSWLDSFHQ